MEGRGRSLAWTLEEAKEGEEEQILVHERDNREGSGGDTRGRGDCAKDEDRREWQEKTEIRG